MLSPRRQANKPQAPTAGLRFFLALPCSRAGVTYAGCPHSCHPCHSLSANHSCRTRNAPLRHADNFMEHEFPELPEYFAIAAHPHSGNSRYSCSTFITRNFYLNTNFPNYPNTLPSLLIHIRAIREIRVQHLSRGIFI